MSNRDTPEGIGIFKQGDQVVLAEDYGGRGYSGVVIDSFTGYGRDSAATQGKQEEVDVDLGDVREPTWWRVCSGGSMETGIRDKEMPTAAQH